MKPPVSQRRVARTPLDKLERYYHQAQRYAWDVDSLGWDEHPLVPRADADRWRVFWKSVIDQQLQADRLAVEAATKLLLRVQEREAKLYYGTMVQDEARHLEGWTRLADPLPETGDEDPYLEQMGQMVMDGETLEEQVVTFQVIFEGLAIDAFRDIARSAEATVLGAMADQLVRDDSIHHNSGVAYAEHLLDDASPALKKHVSGVLKEFAPLYIEHARWRPPARSWLARRMKARDEAQLERNKHTVNEAVTDLGLNPPYDL
jgi:hypothetical protein